VNWSNAFAAIRRQGAAVELYNLNPKKVYPFRALAKQWFAYDTGNGADIKDRFVIFSSDEILHLPALSSDGQIGMGMVKMMSGSLATMKSTERYVNTYHSQGGAMGGVIHGAGKLTREQRKEITDMVTNNFSGTANSHKWMVLGDGFEADTLSPTLDKAAVAENRTFGVLEVCRALRLPPHVIFELGRSTWGNLTQLSLETIKYSLNNWIIPAEQELSRKLLTTAERQAGYRVDFDVSELLRGDAESQSKVASQLAMAGLRTPDELRAKDGLPAYPNGIGSSPRVGLNTTELEPEPEPEPEAQPQPQDEPQDTQEPPKAQPEPDESDMAKWMPVLVDASQRVATKTSKAIQNHKGKDNWTAFSNVFAEQQAKFAAAALGPVYAAMGRGIEEADKASQRYAGELRRHLYAIGKGEASEAPDLAKIADDQTK
jgi:HK97 family phage portal protein